MWTGLRRRDKIRYRVDRFRKFLNKHESIEMADGGCLNTFGKVSSYLSLRVCDILDPDEFDDEIFRLCCRNRQCSSRLQQRQYVQEFLRDYVELYCDIIEKYRPMEVIGDIILKKTCQHFCNNILDFLVILAFFIMSVNVHQVLLGLQLLKMVLCVRKESRELGVGTDLQLLVYNLQLNSVASGGLPHEICNLARECFEILSNPYCMFEGEMDPREYIEKSSFDTKKKFLSKIFRVLVYDGFSNINISEEYYLERIFMSAKTIQEREQYMEALLEAFDNSRRGKFRDDITYEFKNTVKQIIYHLREHYGEPSQKIEVELRCIDKYQGIKIDPYGGPDFVGGTVVSRLLHEDDVKCLIVQKCLIYDYFMRCLQILTILHTAFLRREEIYRGCKGVEGDHKEIFRSNDIESYVCSKLLDRSKCGNLPWYIEMILRNCPFVVFESPDQDIIDSLIKILKKEDVDKDLEIRVYEAIKPVVDDDESSVDDDYW